MMENCSKCIHRECQYREIIKFIELVNIENDKNFELWYCPDACKCGSYNADLEYKDTSSGEKLFIEVKRVFLGYSNKNNNLQKGER